MSKKEFYWVTLKERAFIVSVLVGWIIMALTTFIRADSEYTNEMIPISVFETNTVYVNVPADRQELVNKYLFLAQKYQEQRILRGILLYDYELTLESYNTTLAKMQILEKKKDPAKNAISIGGILCPDFGFELTYYRNIIGPLWMYGRIQTPVGGSTGLGFAW